MDFVKPLHTYLCSGFLLQFEDVQNIGFLFSEDMGFGKILFRLQAAPCTVLRMQT